MKRLINVMGKLQKLAATSGKNAKIDFITANKDDKDFLAMLQYRLNPFYTYKIKKFDAYVMLEPKVTYQAFTDMLDTLIKSSINNKLKQDVIRLLQHTDHTIVDLLEGIITKSLNLGVDSSVNKALDYKLIPTFGCMLAAPLKDGDSVPDEVIVEKKLDGIRCITLVKDGKVKMFTRQGRSLDFPVIAKEVLKFCNGEDLMLDGELTTEARTDVSGICNSNIKSGYTTGTDATLIYTVFDVMPTEVFEEQGVTKSQVTRTSELQQRFISFSSDRLQIVESYQVPIKKAYEINNQYILDGFEGVIVKELSAPYHFKRNKAWRKLKAVNQATLKVIDVELGKGKRKGKVGALICESSCGKLRVKVGSGLSDAEVDIFTTTSPIGKYVEVVYNVIIKGKGSDVYSLFLPRFTSGSVVRIDKDEADSLYKMLDEHIGKPEIA